MKILFVLLLSSLSALAQQRLVSINADKAFDGRRGVLHKVHIEVRADTIVSVRELGNADFPRADYDLHHLIVMPGWIDSHVHITWHFGPKGHFGEKDESPERATLEAEGNAWGTLQAGFTTIQSLGSPEDKPLRDAINSGVIPGPRILTAIDPLSDEKLTPEQIRDFVRKVKAEGADVLKIFASRSIRQGGGQTLSDEQLKAACDEARAQGLRSIVHAYKSAVKASADAGCTEVEHGSLTTDDDLQEMAKKGTWFDPQVGLVIHNYLDNKAKFLGFDGYTEDGFQKMEGGPSTKRADVQACSRDPRSEDHLRNRCSRGRSRTQRRRVHLSRARWRPGPDGRNDLSAIVGREGDGTRQSDRQPRRRNAGRHYRSRWRSNNRHHSRSSSRICDEGRQSISQPALTP